MGYGPSCLKNSWLINESRSHPTPETGWAFFFCFLKLPPVHWLQGVRVLWEASIPSEARKVTAQHKFFQQDSLLNIHTTPGRSTSMENYFKSQKPKELKFSIAQFSVRCMCRISKHGKLEPTPAGIALGYNPIALDSIRKIPLRERPIQNLFICSLKATQVVLSPAAIIHMQGSQESISYFEGQRIPKIQERCVLGDSDNSVQFVG